jgi:hypothetical protein
MNKVEITVDVVTGKTAINETPFTAQELAYSAQVTEQAEVDKIQALSVKQSAIAKLAALGLTEDEVKALVS